MRKHTNFVFIDVSDRQSDRQTIFLLILIYRGLAGPSAPGPLGPTTSLRWRPLRCCNWPLVGGFAAGIFANLVIGNIYTRASHSYLREATGRANGNGEIFRYGAAKVEFFLFPPKNEKGGPFSKKFRKKFYALKTRFRRF